MGMKIDANLSAQPLRQNIAFGKQHCCNKCRQELSEDTVEFSKKNKNEPSPSIFNKLQAMIAAALIAGGAACSSGGCQSPDADTSILNNLPEYMIAADDYSNDTIDDNEQIADYDDFADLDSLAEKYPIDDCEGLAKSIQQIDSIFDSMSKEEQDKFLEFLVDEVRAEKQAEAEKNAQDEEGIQ